ncbi:hypothetical protein [Flavobacterium sp.]|uniref:hypothetical protein n=1 Tax=Flavobacterium sp. TaxID=239 RepID=UPI0025BC1A70|nr:hypothetical protein [Flavobacterium sp.]MBA4155392.1 hypothetical protein [Flavobacterium sp.]
MKSIILNVCFLIISFCGFSQSKEFINSLTPTFPGCENSDDLSKCYRDNVGKLIAAELNEVNYEKPNKIQIELLIRTEANGKSTVLKLKNDDSKIIQLANLALEKMPLIIPLKSSDGIYKSSSSGFFVTLIKNKNGKFEVL